jgi:flagellar motor protein MotB
VRRRRAAADLFPVNVWPPFVDAIVLTLAAFVLLTLMALVTQRALVTRVQQGDRELQALRADKERIERRLRALAPSGSIEVDVDDGKVILQGEVLFDSGADQLRTDGQRVLADLAPKLAKVLEAEPGQMLLVGGHTDDRTLRGDARFASNWELSTARAVAVTRTLTQAGVPPEQIVAAGFGAQHPRVPNTDEAARRKNRRIEVLLVPIHAVASR